MNDKKIKRLIRETILEIYTEGTVTANAISDFLDYTDELEPKILRSKSIHDLKVIKDELQKMIIKWRKQKIYNHAQDALTKINALLKKQMQKVGE